MLVYVYVLTCIHIYSIKQRQSTGWSTGALLPFLSHCWNAPWQLFGPHHPPGSQPGLSAGVTAAGEIHCLLLLEAESAHTYGRVLDRGSRPRPTGAPQQGLQRQQAPRLAIAWSGVLSRKAVLQRASSHGQEERRTILQCASLVVRGLRKTGSCVQVSPFKSSSTTASKQFLVGSRPSSTRSLYVSDQQFILYSNCRVLWGGTGCESVSSPIRVFPTKGQRTSHLSPVTSTELTSAPSCCVLSRVTWRLVLTKISEETLFF